MLDQPQLTIFTLIQGTGYIQKPAQLQPTERLQCLPGACNLLLFNNFFRVDDISAWIKILKTKGTVVLWLAPKTERDINGISELQRKSGIGFMVIPH